MRITVLGASGFVGRHLVAALRARGDDVRAASLRKLEDAVAACDGAQAVVNLAGEPIAQRWTPRVKTKLRASRIDATRALLEALRRGASRPSVYVSASAIGYYGTSETSTFVESSAPGTDFLAHLCVDWEAAADAAAALGMRVAKVRTGLALGTDGGALAKLLPVFRAGAGGVVASGRQWYSWIAIDDLIGVYVLALDRVEGPLDATAPNPVRNAEFTRALARTLHRPAVLPVPAFALRALLGEAALVLTQGQRVLPERTAATGYAFRYPSLDEALGALLCSRKGRA